jgi:hypothetical protein
LLIAKETLTAEEFAPLRSTAESMEPETETSGSIEPASA